VTIRVESSSVAMVSPPMEAASLSRGGSRASTSFLSSKISRGGGGGAGPTPEAYDKNASNPPSLLVVLARRLSLFASPSTMMNSISAPRVAATQYDVRRA